MRVIEPKKFSIRDDKKHRNSIHFGKKRFIAVITIIVALGFSLHLINKKKDSPAQQVDQVEVADTPVVEQVFGEAEENKTGLRQFSGNEFRLLFDNLLLPNTVKVELPPSITGNEVADARIRLLAETRGYKLRRSPLGPLPSVDGYQLHDAVHQPWLDLKAEASNEGINISIVSGYRSVEEQRELFVSRLTSDGVTVSSIEAGNADDTVDKLLVTTSIPGYSKHHTGYVFDLLCAGWIFENFKDSNCNEWLEKNNYEKAKKYGFIPSYPIDADLQGPDPEAWEYVYVGTEILNQ